MISRHTAELAYTAQATIAATKEMVRSHLLAILSEARAMTAGKLEPKDRDKLMDGLAALHPDNAVADLVTDAFYDTEQSVAAAVEEVGELT